MAKIHKLYLYSTVGFMLVLPLASIAVAMLAFDSRASAWSTSTEWFVFWGVGVRLLVAGIKQAAQPAFTAEQIFGITHPQSYALVRELGFANMCMGSVAVISLVVPEWRLAAAYTGGLYFGIAGLQHVIKKPATAEETLALWSDLFIFAVMAACLIHARLI